MQQGGAKRIPRFIESDGRLEGFPMANFLSSNGRHTLSVEQNGLLSTRGQDLQSDYVGFAHASFLLGSIDKSVIGWPSYTRLSKSASELFAQDSWKVTSGFNIPPYAGCPIPEIANSVLFPFMLLFRLTIARFLDLKSMTCISDR